MSLRTGSEKTTRNCEIWHGSIQHKENMKMERRGFVKSLLPLAALFSFGKLGSPNGMEESYKGKRLVVVSSNSLMSMCKKREAYVPQFKSERDISEEMRRFVDMSEGHLNELGHEVYGCVHRDGNYSVASFAPRSCPLERTCGEYRSET